jgi:hypothetical protein
MQSLQMLRAKEKSALEDQIVILFASAKQGTFSSLLRSKPQWVTKAAISTPSQIRGQGGKTMGSGWTPLHVAARHCHLDQITPWITQESLLLPTATGVTPILLAAQYECLGQLPKRLLSKKVMLTSVHGHPTALMQAAKTPEIQHVPASILTVKNLTARDSSGKSPLQEIAERGYLSLLPSKVQKVLSTSLPSAEWKQYKDRSTKAEAFWKKEVVRQEAESPDGVPF